MAVEDDGGRYCPRCGREVSRDSIACPYCASPLPKADVLEDSDVGDVAQPSDLIQESPAALSAPPPAPPPAPEPPAEPDATEIGWAIDGGIERMPSLPVSPSAGGAYPPPPAPPPSYGSSEFPMPVYSSPIDRMPRTPAMENVGFWPRVGAYLIDSLIIGFPLGAILGIMVVTAGVDITDEDTLNIASLVVQGIGGLVTLIYFTLMNGAYGATLGKMALGLKVVRQDGSPIGYGVALGRIILMQVLSGCTCSLFFISVATNEEYRGWHDQICGTRVIYNR